MRLRVFSYTSRSLFENSTIFTSSGFASQFTGHYLYGGPLLYCKDAFDGLHMMDAITGGLVQQISTEQQERALKRKRQRAEPEAKYGDTMRAASKDAPEIELAVFVLRMMLKHGTWDAVAVGKGVVAATLVGRVTQVSQSAKLTSTQLAGNMAFTETKDTIMDMLTVDYPINVIFVGYKPTAEEVAHFLGGHGEDGRQRPVTIVDSGIRKPLIVDVVIPVEDMGDLGSATPTPELRSGPATVAMAPQRSSIWPSIYPRVLELVLAQIARLPSQRSAAELDLIIACDPEDIVTRCRRTNVSADAASVIISHRRCRSFKDRQVLCEIRFFVYRDIRYTRA